MLYYILRFPFSLDSRHIECINLLLKANADINIKNNKSLTVFDLATTVGLYHRLIMLSQAIKILLQSLPKVVGKPKRF